MSNNGFGSLTAYEFGRRAATTADINQNSRAGERRREILVAKYIGLKVCASLSATMGTRQSIPPSVCDRCNCGVYNQRP